MEQPEFYSLTEFTEWMRRNGVVKSRQTWQRRARLGTLGRKIGNQYIVGAREAEKVLASCRKDA